MIKPLQESLSRVLDFVKSFISSGDIHGFAKESALKAAKDQREHGSSEELCSDAMKDILYGVSIAIQAATPTIPNPYAIVLASSAGSLAKWACHEAYKNN